MGSRPDVFMGCWALPCCDARAHERQRFQALPRVVVRSRARPKRESYERDKAKQGRAAFSNGRRRAITTGC